MRVPSIIYERMLASSGLIKWFWDLNRKALIKLFNDPACSLKIHGRHLKLPLSHALPLYLNRYPFYDTLPERLSEYMYRKYGLLKCVDVGANIGDSIAAFFRHETDTFLAIEASPKYYRYLDENWKKEKNVTTLNVICSSASGFGTYEIQEHSGAAFISRAEGGVEMQAKSLDDIVDEHHEFEDFNLLKIDTDGHDFEVIFGAKKVITRNIPAILFECAALSNTTYIEDCLETLSFIKSVGYISFLLYDNYGYLLGKFSLDDLANFKDLLFYQLTNNFIYFDILLMKEKDIVLFLDSEKSFFIDHIPNKALQQTAKAAAGLCR